MNPSQLQSQLDQWDAELRELLCDEKGKEIIVGLHRTLKMLKGKPLLWILLPHNIQQIVIGLAYSSLAKIVASVAERSEE